ncbi:hypothetical protein MXD62_23025 [Frankia sp. Mgl5]|uniref:hypothetical protein n=1 Tax=Frankia sp. Mgl5 TaxID=2933793 RepID=UPI00200E6CAF|nr:hypothetical protein [Frankia sp. Mgl5]MCK9930003.1 hypothetical protein [Frankia sp. Mgl5]
MAELDLAALRARYEKDTTRINGQAARRDIGALLSRIGLLEETVLAAATLLYPGEDWGPRPPGPRESYDAYLSEGVHDEAVSVRAAWKTRGFRRV